MRFGCPVIAALNVQAMIQKYSAIYTLGVIILLFVGAATQFDPGVSLGEDMSDEVRLVGIAIFVMPLMIHTLSMLFHMMINGRGYWFVGALFFAFVATLAYWYFEYRKKETFNKSGQPTR